MKDRRKRCERPPATSSGSACEGPRTFVAIVQICFGGLPLASDGKPPAPLLGCQKHNCWQSSDGRADFQPGHCAGVPSRHGDPQHVEWHLERQGWRHPTKQKAPARPCGQTEANWGLGVRHSLFPMLTLGAPLRGCQLPDAIFHGKRNLRPYSGAVQRLAVTGF
jgi:hypothetical protein